MTFLNGFLLAAGALTSATLAAAAPTSAYQVCESLLSNQMKIDCLRAIGGQETDRNAAGVCAQMLGDTNKLNCIRAIAGRIFDPMAVSACNSTFGDLARIRCLENAGRWPRDRDPGPWPRDPDCVGRNELVQALRNIRADINDWRVNDARRGVENLISRIENCRN